MDGRKISMKKIIALITIFTTLLATAPVYCMLVKLYSAKQVLHKKYCHANHHPHPAPEMYELFEENCILERHNQELLIMQRNNRQTLLIAHHKNRLLNEQNEHLIEIIREFKSKTTSQ